MSTCVQPDVKCCHIVSLLAGLVTQISCFRRRLGSGQAGYRVLWSLESQAQERKKGFGWAPFLPNWGKPSSYGSNDAFALPCPFAQGALMTIDLGFKLLLDALPHLFCLLCMLSSLGQK